MTTTELLNVISVILVLAKASGSITLNFPVAFIFPFVILFSELAKKDYGYIQTVWLSFPIAEVLSTVVAVLLFRRIYAKKVSVFHDDDRQCPKSDNFLLEEK